jgi:tetratricopeptide (TPR) repeat protein
VLGGIIYWHGEVDGARDDYEAALEIWRGIGDQREIANAAYNLSFVFTMGILRELPPNAREHADALLEEALDIYRSLGDAQGEANVQWGIGIQHYFANDNAAAEPAFRASLELYRKLGDRTQEAWSLHQLGLSLLKLGKLDEARGPLAEGLRLFAEAGDVAGVTLGLDNFSSVAAADGDLPKAARLSGLARRIQASSGTGLAGVVEQSFEAATRPNAGRLMPPADFARYEAEGAAMSMADGVRYALGETEPA